MVGRHEKKLTVAAFLDSFQELFWNDRVRINIGTIERHYRACMCFQSFHGYTSSIVLTGHLRTSVKWPAIAAAPAIAGLTKWVRANRPCLPSKFRLDVEATRSPGPAMSGFIPRHMLQPASRHSNPADLKISSKFSSSAILRRIKRKE